MKILQSDFFRLFEKDSYVFPLPYCWKEETNRLKYLFCELLYIYTKMQMLALVHSKDFIEYSIVMQMWNSRTSFPSSSSFFVNTSNKICFDSECCAENLSTIPQYAILCTCLARCSTFNVNGYNALCSAKHILLLHHHFIVVIQHLKCVKYLHFYLHSFFWCCDKITLISIKLYATQSASNWLVCIVNWWPKCTKYK